MRSVVTNWTSPISSSDSKLRISFSTRFGGVSEGAYGIGGHGLNLATHVGDDPERVSRNRQVVRDIFDLPQVSYMDQVHGNSVAVIDFANQRDIRTVDALVTRERGIALAVLTADCVPLMMHDAEAGVIAAVHVGRRGLVNGVVNKTVVAMQSLGAVEIRSLMGPAICGDCYEVPIELQREIEAIAPNASSITDSGTPGVDIRDGVTWQLRQLGIDSVVDPICTKRSELHYSYRRDGVTGRTAGFIHLI
jgi:YfiH family protein